MSDSPYKLSLCDSDDANKTVYSVETPLGERFDTVRIHRVGDPAETEWLWPDRIPLGKVTVIEGAPGAGESRVAFDLAARVAGRRSWPDGTPSVLPAADVLVISRHEEAACITAQVQGVEGEKRSVFRFEGFATRLPKADLYGDRPMALPYDLEALDYHLECNMSIGVVIIDPLTDFCRTPRLLGETLHQLNILAARHRIALIVTVPADCRTDPQGKLRVTSRWPTEAARCVWCIVPDPDEPRRRLIMARRTNFCQEPDGFAFRLDANGVVWEVQTAISAVDPLGALSGSERCLQELLSTGRLPAKTVFRLGTEQGFSEKQLRSAAQRLGIAHHRVGFREEGHWEWSLPNDRLPIAAAVALTETPQHLTVDADISAAGDHSAGGVPESPAFEREPVEEKPIATLVVAPTSVAPASGQMAGDSQVSHAELAEPCNPNRGTVLAPTASAVLPTGTQPESPLPMGRRRGRGKYRRRKLRQVGRRCGDGVASAGSMTG